MRKRLINNKFNKTYNKIALSFITMFSVMPKVLASEEDPIAVVNNLSDFIFTFVTGIGVIIIGYGIAQIGISFTSHDASQRVNGVMYAVGGIIMFFAKSIINIILGG